MVQESKFGPSSLVQTQSKFGPSTITQAITTQIEKPQLPERHRVDPSVIPVTDEDRARQEEEFGFSDVLGRITEPFKRTDFGFDPDTQKIIDENLSFEGKAILGPVLALGEAGLSVLEGIGAAIEGGTAGTAAIVRALGGFEGSDFSPKTAERKLAKDLNLLANLGLLISGGRPSAGIAGTTRAVRTKAVKAPSKAAVIKRAPSEEALTLQKNELFKIAEDAGVAFKRKSVKQFINKAKTKLEKQGLDADLHPSTTAALKRAEKLADKPSATLQETEIVRRLTGDATQSVVRSDARLARLLRDEIDDLQLNTPSRQALSGDVRAGSKALNEARAVTRRLKKSEIITEAFVKAENQASGFENGLRVQFRSILNNKKTRNQFTKEEQQAIRKVVQGGPLENALKVIGKFGISEGQASNPLLALGGSVAGGAAGGVPGAVAVPLIGQVAKTGAQALTRRNAEFARALVREGATNSQARKAVQVKRQLDELGTFSPEAAENLARIVALGSQEASATVKQQ